MIKGASYEIRSSDIFEKLKWDLKATIFKPRKSLEL